MKQFIGGIILALLFVVPSLVLGLQTGEHAPAFEAQSTQGKIRLEDYRSKKNVVLVFYFADFTPV